MAADSAKQITELLADWSDGDRSALDSLMPMVHDELRRMAHHYMQNERAGHTLETTGLVSEAYLRLVDHQKMKWQNRAHFFAIAAQVMRRVLVDYARTRQRDKRGGDVVKVPLDEVTVMSEERSTELIALDDALTKLAEFDSRKSEVVVLRFFGGLNNEEVAEVLKVHPNTVMRDWNFAEAWLRREMGHESHELHKHE